jgi:hypothetical protein
MTSRFSELEQCLPITPEWSATRKLATNGVVGDRSASSAPLHHTSHNGTSGESARFRLSGKRGGFYRWTQHHLIDVLFKDGVYERRETIETFSHAENRNLEPVEVRAVVA